MMKSLPDFNAKSGFPIWKDVSRILCFLCPRHNEFAFWPGSGGDGEVPAPKLPEAGLPQCDPLASGLKAFFHQASNA
jgi:hypothetical protein